MSIKQFQIGRTYEHNAGPQMYICGLAFTIYHGTCFIAESGWNREKLKERIAKAKADGEKMPADGFDRKELIPVSMSDDGTATVNWFEITKEEFLKNNTSK